MAQHVGLLCLESRHNSYQLGKSSNSVPKVGVGAHEGHLRFVYHSLEDTSEPLSTHPNIKELKVKLP